MSDMRSDHRDAARIPAHVRKRMRPSIIVVDSELSIVQYERRAITLLRDSCGPSPAGQIPHALGEPLRGAIERIESDGNPALTSSGSLIIHVSRLLGGGKTLYALLLERESFRAPVDSAASRFSLTAREREVLVHVLRGYHASDIAQSLGISQATLSGYFKALLRKTQTRTRSEMIARVLDWEEGRDSSVRSC